MECQSNDQPLKWIERIKDGLFTNKYFICEEILSEKMLYRIFTNIRERTKSGKNCVDFDVTFNNKEYLLRLSSSNWKLIPKNSVTHKVMMNLSNYNNFNLPKSINEDQAEDSCLKELKELRVIIKRLKRNLGSYAMQGDPAIIKAIINCNEFLLKMITKWKNEEWKKKRNQKRQENIEKYKKDHSWIPNEEWEKLSFFQKVIKRWKFSDMHQCLVPWEMKKLSNEELALFWEKKRKWRMNRKKELENNPIQMKIFDKFCHARNVGWKIFRNLDSDYTDSFSKGGKSSGGKIIIHKKN